MRLESEMFWIILQFRHRKKDSNETYSGIGECPAWVCVPQDLEETPLRKCLHQTAYSKACRAFLVW